MPKPGHDPGGEGVAVGDLFDLAVEDREIPAVGAFVPLAAVLAAYGSIEPDVGGDVAPVGFRALAPGVDVFQGPVAILLLVSQQVGVERQVGRCQVERVVSHAIEVLGAVREHLGVVGFQVDHRVAATLTVKHMEAAGHGISDPIVRRGLAEHRAFAAGPEASNNLVLGIVVGRLGIFVHVQAGEAVHALSKPLVGRFAQSEEHEAAHSFAGVEQVRHGDELLVVRAVFGQLGLGGSEFLVLLKVAFESFLERLKD